MNEKFEFGYPGASSTCQEGSDVNTIMPPGDGLDELVEQKGHLVNLRVLWSSSFPQSTSRLFWRRTFIIT